MPLQAVDFKSTAYHRFRHPGRAFRPCKTPYNASLGPEKAQLLRCYRVRTVRKRTTGGSVEVSALPHTGGMPGLRGPSPLLRLQSLMRDQESRLAAYLAEQSDRLVLCDGPIGFLDLKRSPVVGVARCGSR